MNTTLVTTTLLVVLLASSWPIAPAAAEDEPATTVAPSASAGTSTLPCKIRVSLDPALTLSAAYPDLGCLQPNPDLVLSLLNVVAAYAVGKVPCGTAGKPKCDQEYVCSRPGVDCTPEMPRACPGPTLGVIVDGFAYCVEADANGLPCGGAEEPKCVDFVCDHPLVQCSRDLPLPSYHACDPPAVGYVFFDSAGGDSGAHVCINIPSTVPTPDCGLPGRPPCYTPRVPDVFCAAVLDHCIDADCDDLTGKADCGTGGWSDFAEEETPAVLILAGMTSSGTYTLHQSVPLPDGTWETRAMSEGTAKPNVQCGAMDQGDAHAEDLLCQAYFPVHNVDTMWVFYGTTGCDCATTGSTKNYMSHSHADGSAHGKGWRVNWANGQALVGDKCQEYSGNGGKVLHADWMFGGISTDSSGYCNTPQNPWAYPYGYWGAGLTFK